MEVFCDWFDVLHGPEHIAPVRHDNEPCIFARLPFLSRKGYTIIGKWYDRKPDYPFLLKRSERAEHRVVFEFCGDRMERHTALFGKSMNQQVKRVGGILCKHNCSGGPPGTLPQGPPVQQTGNRLIHSP